tara:strand:+ start:233 stop:535 length:303 start_codon:yes stop_codon:yes gene_type:complete
VGEVPQGRLRRGLSEYDCLLRGREMKAKLTFIVTVMVSLTLCVVVLSMSGVMLFGLFDPLVDNNKIFELVGPAFQTVVGGFIGLLAGVKLSHEDEKDCKC